TDIVKADGVGQLSKEHAHHVTPGTEGSRLGIHAGLARKFGHQMGWNQIAKLSQNRELGGGWFGISFLHLCRVTELKSHSNHFFRPKIHPPVGWLRSFFATLKTE